jgi:hypothetical protein
MFTYKVDISLIQSVFLLSSDLDIEIGTLSLVDSWIFVGSQG